MIAYTQCFNGTNTSSSIVGGNLLDGPQSYTHPCSPLSFIFSCVLLVFLHFLEDNLYSSSVLSLPSLGVSGCSPCSLLCWLVCVRYNHCLMMMCNSRGKFLSGTALTCGAREMSVVLCMGSCIGLWLCEDVAVRIFI